MRTSVKTKLRRKPNKKGLFGIVFQIIINSKSTEISAGHYIDKKHFNVVQERVKPSHPRSIQLNKVISDGIKKIEDIIFELNQKGESFNTRTVTSIFKGQQNSTDDNKTLVAYLEAYIIANPERLSPTTIPYYNTTLKRLKEHVPNLELRDIREEHIISFKNYLIDKCDNSTNTVYNRLKTVRKITRRAKREGHISHNPFMNVKLKQEEGRREYLTEEQLKLVAQFSPINKTQSLAKDIFLFSAYTGLRFSDCCTLKNSEIERKENDQFRIKFQVDKSKRMLEFTLNNRAKDILLRYANKESLYVFPMLDKLIDGEGEVRLKKIISSKNAMLNKYLKSIITALNISKKISMHCARHTYAVLSIEKGADLYILSKMLGHKSVSTTEIYAKAVDKRKDELTQLWNE